MALIKSLLEELSANAKNYNNIYIEFNLMIENKIDLLKVKKYLA